MMPDSKMLILIFFLQALTVPVFAQSEQVVTGINVGNKAPEINLANPQGALTSLNSLKGHIVLIDFWASWCAPCVQEQPMLLSLYRKYRNVNFKNGNGFEIFSISLDNKKEKWVATINKMKLNWAQVSDLKFWNSAAAKIYGIEELPYNVLIDGNGIIIAKNLHGNELEGTLRKLIK